MSRIEIVLSDETTKEVCNLMGVNEPEAACELLILQKIKEAKESGEDLSGDQSIDIEVDD